ncbi:MAG: hypothetical protein GF317_11225 [Candidatus Lokiarchaeota archaeon]|nr:hypothetical protein [Candidatus Lokiarchaeota archaeon]MBD3200220.1 hypothetical protein [Candidatus Lokiarchaeota archaeon]
METRNFYILIASVAVAFTCFWLTLYAIITLDIDIFQDPDTVIIKGQAIDGELSISLSELKSDKYEKIESHTFDIKNSVGREYERIYSGVSLRSIFEVEDLISGNPSLLYFKFRGRDGYITEALPLSTVFNNLYNETIIAFADGNGHPLFEEGPLRSVIDQSVMPIGEVASQYSVQKLAIIEVF